MYNDEEYQEPEFKSTLRADNELFDERQYKPHPIINVKFSNKNQEDFWEISINNKLMLKISGSKLSKNERKFLTQPQGMTFLIHQIKLGNVSFNKIKEQLRKQL